MSLSEELTKQKKKGRLKAKTNRSGLSVEKARLMLHEGTANGKPITDKQRRYFGYVAGHSKWQTK